MLTSEMYKINRMEEIIKNMKASLELLNIEKNTAFSDYEYNQKRERLTDAEICHAKYMNLDSACRKISTAIHFIKQC